MIKLEQGIALLSGEVFDYNNPEACSFQITDIARALSNVCRFAGHLPRFYSVAQHAVNASNIVTPEFAFDALMHDTAEAFTNDLPTPLKWAFPVFKELEVRIESAVAKKYGFTFPLHPDVKLADTQMLKLEKENVKKDTGYWKMLEGIETDHLKHLVNLSPMTPTRAYDNFMTRFEELNNARTQKRAPKISTLRATPKPLSEGPPHYTLSRSGSASEAESSYRRSHTT